MKPENEVVAYVEGRESIKDFYDATLKSEAIQKLLEDETDIPPYTKSGNLFLYLMNLDVSNPEADVALKDVLSKLLEKSGIDHRMDTSAMANFELMLDATPTWLTLPDFYIKKLQEKTASFSSRKDKLAAAKKMVKEDFVYLKKVPNWIQSPEWMFNKDCPMLFIGQLDLGDLKHDRSQIYVFYDKDGDVFHTVVQVA